MLFIRLARVNGTRHRCAISILAAIAVSMIALLSGPDAFAQPRDPRKEIRLKTPAIDGVIGRRLDFAVTADKARFEAARVRVPVKMEGSDVLAERQVNGRWVEARERVRAEPPGEASIELIKGEPTLVRPAEAIVQPLSTEKSYFPAKLLLHTGQTQPDGTPLVRTWALFLRCRTEPITWSADDRAYATHLVVGVDDESSSDDSAVLPAPISVQLFSAGEHVRVSEALVVIEKSGPAGYKDTKILCERHEATPKVTAKTTFGSRECEFRMRPSLGRLDLEILRGVVQGFGLESAAFTVRRFAEDGVPFGAETELAVSLAVTKGDAPAAVTIPAGSYEASGQIRSGGYGAVSVTASAGSVRSEPRTLDFEFPSQLLAITVGFGGLGGLVQELKTKRRTNRRGSGFARALRRFGPPVVIGLFAGIIVTLGEILLLGNTSLAPGAVSAGVAAALLAGCAGYVGTPAIDRVVEKIGLGGAATNEEAVKVPR